MPVVVVATLTVKPESVDVVRDILTTAVEEVHEEPGCQLYSLHQSGETFVFVEQWADEDALKTHSTAPAVGKMFSAAGEHLAGAPDIKMLQPVPRRRSGQGTDSPLMTQAHWPAKSRLSPALPAGKVAPTRSGWHPMAPTSSGSTLRADRQRSLSAGDRR